MSTPTTVKFQIAVSSKDGNGQATEKLFLVDMTVASESGEVIGIELLPTPGTVSNDNESLEGTMVTSKSEVLLPQDPPRAQVAISIAA
ncbi:MAG TPA: hypothetical protein VF179_22350 [Thermoanaerobaculia bacterium]|nr:hypothetical protein [Thermoanaerobaculia bacterium]